MIDKESQRIRVEYHAIKKAQNSVASKIASCTSWVWS